LKIASIVGARPNFVKLAAVHRAFKTSPSIKHTIIHTGQHYDFYLSEVFFREFRLPKPTANLNVGSGSTCYQLAEIVKRLEKTLSNSNFDLVLVYGDTNSTLAGALAAVSCRLKVAHIEAGLRSFDRQMPEEINRVLTDNVSSYLFVPTEGAIDNLHNEHVSGEIIYSGDLSVEIVAQAVETGTKSSTILRTLQLEPKSYILLTMHRAENTMSSNTLLQAIRAIEVLKDTTIIFPIHPRTYNALKEKHLLRRISKCKNLKLIQPLGYVDFIKLAQNSKKIITDSGGIQKEAYLLRVPCITIRQNTEWIETIDQGSNKLTQNSTYAIVNAVRKWFPERRTIKPILGKGNTSIIIREKILSLSPR